MSVTRLDLGYTSGSAGEVDPQIHSLTVTGGEEWVDPNTSLAGETRSVAVQLTSPPFAPALVVGVRADGTEDALAQFSATDRSLQGGWSGTATITFPNGLTLADGEQYTIEVRAYTEVPGSDPTDTESRFIFSSPRPHYGVIGESQGTSDIAFATTDIAVGSAFANLNGRYVIAVPDSGYHRLYWMFPPNFDPPTSWEIDSVDILPSLERSTVTVGGVAYDTLIFRSAHAVDASYNGRIIETRNELPATSSR